jgi:general secretion pathway protein K
VSAARSQRGAALLLAMLTVTLVATLAATALWQQWRGVEIEAAERKRSQMAWILNGALDWARLILQEDARSSQVDHLSEPWALPLEEARLSSFLAFDKNNNTDDSLDAFLSGQIVDMQSRMNVLNLVDNGKLHAASRPAFAKLFDLLGLPAGELDALAENLRLASTPPAAAPQAPLLPQRVEQLAGLGLSSQSLKTLTPYITVLPARTAVNLNTASAEVICATLPGIDIAQAQRLALQRSLAHFRNIADILRATGIPGDKIDTSQLSVSTQYFEVIGRLRLDQTVSQEHSLVERNGPSATVLWRERTVLRAMGAARPER